MLASEFVEEYKGFAILAKAFSNLALVHGKIYRSGYFVVKNNVNVMPNNVFFTTVCNAKKAIDFLLESDGSDLEKFWVMYHSMLKNNSTYTKRS